MSVPFKWSLLPTVIATAGLLAGDLAVSRPAHAQTAAPPAPPGADAPQPVDAGDPPARVGWLSNLSGAVSFHSASQDQWTTATQNYPIATGDAVWTQPQAQASIMVDASRIALNGGTELTAQEIDQTTMTAVLSQGEVFLNLVAMRPGQSVVIETPRGTAQITSNGRYEIYAGDSSTPTYVTAVTGAAQFTGPGLNTPQAVGAQQTLVVSGTDPVQAQLGALQQDQFLTAMLQQIAPPPPPTNVAPPPVVSAMTGASVLSQYGSWSSEPDAGTVWFPQVASSWVPYRDGRWAYVQPWGWTWVDNAPWGFAPFHYGRWSEFNGRWGWVPAPAAAGVNYADYQPVYAPALVTFLGAAVGAATAAAFASGSIGWAPLGLRDPYYPPYRVTPRYFGAYNRPYVENYNQFYQRNVTVVNNRITYRNVEINNAPRGPQGENFARRGATFVPREAMLDSRPVAGVARPLPQGARVQPFHPGAPQGLPRPTAATWGVTPAMAQREHLEAGPAGGGPRAPAPGPAIRPMQGAHFAPGARPAPPPLVAHAAERPGFQAGPAHGTPVPGAAQPGAPQPGAPQPRALPPLPRVEAHPGNAQPLNAQAGGPQPGEARPAGVRPAGAPPSGVPQAPFHGTAQGPGNGPGQVHGPDQHGPAPQAPHVPQPRPAPQARPAPAPQQAPQAPRPQPTPHAQAPRPAPRPAPQMQAPRPAPHVEAPRPAPHVQAPRPAPRAEAPRPAPHVQAPHPAPHPPPQGHAPQQNVRPPK
ncbi:MAG TPA: DUF6600 domain-containing protein [Acidisoma sp.]|uniref:DUF6600 domain-containing protein n=1 Tax=Acidisoma sp. TaxID=1872115 RepID=UPI002C65A71B|nr:DUF6600 domain-containing protein [Acidisoma sp.]HTI00525.1 DUF6600 domain-containing protein [Acidisoma sp.]